MTGPAAGTPAPRSGFAGTDAAALQQLAKVAIELSAAETMSGIVDAAVTHVADAVQAAVSTLMVREGDEIVLLGGRGLRPGVDERWHSFPLDHDNPASEAARTGQVVTARDPEGRYRSLAGEVPAGRSLLCLPLGAAVGEPVGVVGMTFDDGWLPGPVELDILTTFAEACGQAIRRVTASRQAALRAEQLTFLARASAELSASLDYRATLAKVAALAVPTLADWCAVGILDGPGLTTLAVAHEDPAKIAWAWELQKRYPPDPDAPTGAPNVVRTGRSELFEEITDDMLVAGAVDEEHLRIARQLNLRSAVVVPIHGRDRPLGAITLIHADSGRRYTAADLSVAEDLGRRAGAAIENARLHSQTRDVALQLQRAVLPDALDPVPGCETATYYEPGGHAGVGGDFYDAVALPDGRVALFIGDVMGHGVAAAAAMAHVRASIRAFLTVDPDPASVLANLEQMFVQLSMRQLVTVVYALLDCGTGELIVVDAGHHAPVVVRGDGRVEVVTVQRREALGAGQQRTAPVAAQRLTLGRGDAVLLYTDGLIERRGEVIDVGMRRLLEAAGMLVGADLDVLLAELVIAVQPSERDDDVTALAVRYR